MSPPVYALPAYRLIILLVGLLLPWASQAGEGNIQILRQQAIAWLQQQVQEAYPDTLAQVELGPLDPRLRLAPCEAIQFFLPVGAHLWRNGSLGMKCGAPAPWSLYLTYKIQLHGPALLTQRPLPARYALNTADVLLSTVAYNQDPGSYVHELPAGAMTLRAMQINQPILIQDLVQADIIRAGTQIQVRVHGRGFSVAQEGKALNAAKVGGTVQVKMPSGRIVRGVANSSGEVEIRP